MSKTMRRSVNPRLMAVEPRVLRPRDATWWRNPAKELSRLAGDGIVASPAHGWYVVPPPSRLGDSSWRPTLEGFALALAQRSAGVDDAALMGVSAARILGALPRAVATAVVASSQRRRPVKSAWGTVRLVARDVSQMDTRRIDTDLASGWATTVEQTLLDLAERPELGELDPRTVSEALTTLGSRADWERVADLAARSHRPAAFARARWIADAVIARDAPRPPMPFPHRRAPLLGLTPAAPTPHEPFGLVADG